MDNILFYLTTRANRDPHGTNYVGATCDLSLRVLSNNINGEEISSPFIVISKGYPINNCIVEPRLRSLHV